MRINQNETFGERNKNNNLGRVELIDEKEFLHIQQFRKSDSTPTGRGCY
jgi:hypothetical protein